MKKRLLLVLLIALVAVPQAFAVIGFVSVCESGQTLYYKINGNNVSVEKGNLQKGDLIIPSTVTYQNEVYNVNKIGIRAFSGCTELTSVSIPNSVTSIGEDAFFMCSGLTSVNIPNSVTSIGEQAFCMCSGLTSVNIPNSVTHIGINAFSRCTGLTSIDIPNSLTQIGEYTFPGCTSLTSVNIPNSVTHIGINAFSRCTGLTSVSLPNSVTSIGEQAFYGCTGLTSVVIPNNVTYIGAGALGNCSRLSSITVDKDNTVYDSRDNCNAIIETKTNQLVCGCSNTIIPDYTTKICDYAFDGCRGLSSINIPSSVTEFGNYAFRGCGLIKVNYTGSIAEWCKIIFNYKSTCDGRPCYEYTYSNPIFGNNLFIKNVEIKDLVIPKEVESIEDHAFYGCTSLTSVNIPNPVSIGDNAFQYCANLKTAYLSILTNFATSKDRYPFPETTKFIITGITISDINTCSATFICDDIFKEMCDSLSNPVWKVIDFGLYCSNGEYFKANMKNTITVNNLQSNQNFFVKPCFYYEFGKESEILPYTSGLEFNFATKSLNPTITATEIKSTSIATNCSFFRGDATITSEEFVVNGTTFPFNNGVLTGLLPDTEYSVTYRVNTTTGSEETTQTFRTAKDLTLKTLNPKVSEGKVVVCAETNISDYETNVGFEWRKYDAPSSLPSKSGQASIYNGGMKGTIKNLATDAYWNVRAYYTANDGTSYYGDWVTFDPSDFSEFEPEVHTYPATVYPNQPLQLRGYAVEGSEEVEEQGFEYWPKMPSTRITEPEGIKRIPATGTVMQATITDYEYSTEYICRSYVKTSTKTFYGEEQTFTTPEDPRPLYTFIVQAGENGRVNEEVNGQYREGESVEIIATPNQGYKFTQWSDLMTENPRTVTVTQDTTIVASFENTEVSTPDILADPDKTGVQISDVLGRLHKVHNWNNLKGELRRGVYILFKGKESQKILVE